MFDFLQELVKNGLPVVFLWIAGAALTIYLLAEVWTHLSVDRLFWQNLLGRNRVELPRLARLLKVQTSGTGGAENKALVLVRATPPAETEEAAPVYERGIIYPVAGRSGLNFNPALCSSCGICAYICPAKAVSTREQEAKISYLRIFDLASCIFCGMCESACPTRAIKLTINPGFGQEQVFTPLVQGEVPAEPCPKCQLIAPRPDLFAERIYRFELAPLEEPDGFTPAEIEGRHYQLERGKLLVQPEGACPECQKQVLNREKKIENRREDRREDTKENRRKDK